MSFQKKGVTIEIVPYFRELMNLQLTKMEKYLKLLSIV